MQNEKHMQNWNIACDAAFIVALREEIEAADIFDPHSDEAVENNLDLEIHRRHMHDVDGKDLKILSLLIDDQGPEHAAIATTKFLQHVRPKLLILIGISGKISDDVKLGDVVLANLCDNSLHRAKKKEQKILPGGKEWPLDALSKKLYSGLELSPPFYSYSGLSNHELSDLRNRGFIRQTPKTVHGPICATPYVVDDPEFADWLKTSRNRNILATDMESVAVVQAAHENGVRNGRVLVIRGISDPADGRKAESDALGTGILRKIAIRNAGQLASHAISRLLTFTAEQVSVRGLDADRPLLEAKLSSFKESLKFLEQLASRIDARESEASVCSWADDSRRENQIIGTQVTALAQAAYRQEIEKQPSDSVEVLAVLKPTSLDYLVACWIIYCLLEKELSHQPLETLSNVYPQRVNRFCKAMLAILPDERKLVDRLISAYEARPAQRGPKAAVTRERAKAHICYLLGRVRTPQQRKRAAEAMTKWRYLIISGSRPVKKLQSGPFQLDRVFSSLDSAEKRLLLRTICISLILLDQPGEAEVYVRACIRNGEFDSLNRGFHLEYYGDIDYDPRESMNNTDPVFNSISKTFAMLYEKLSKSLLDNQSYPLRAVDLQTLLSLCQQRLTIGMLDPSQQSQMLGLLSAYKDTRLTSIKLLQSYCGMMREHLGAQNFKRSNLLRKLFELKKLPRAGWNDCDDDHTRTTPNPESVLSHTAGGMLLIQFCLPERLSKDDKEKIGEESAKAYSKDAIMRMFLVHDLAEAYIGDLTPRQRNDVAKANERRVNSYIDLFSTYPGFYHHSMFSSWQAFENASNINGKVAREIDLLENLLQLSIEFESVGVQISDYDYWKDDLIRRIETPMSRRILEILLQ